MKKKPREGRREEAGQVDRRGRRESEEEVKIQNHDVSLGSGYVDN